MYDRNGLELSPVSHRTMNSYKFTTVDLKIKRYNAYASIHSKYENENFGMVTIRAYKDPRDAAFVGQEFNKMYNKFVARELQDAGDLRDVITDFLENVEIPEWKFPSEGLSIEELLGEVKYRTNRVDSAKEALIEAIKLTGSKPPALNLINEIVKKVEKLYKEGLTYREAALEVIKEG